MKNEIAIKICFESKTSWSNILRDIVRNKLFGFIPLTVESSDRNNFDEQEFLEDLKQIERNEGIIFRGENNEQLTVSYPAGENTPLTFTWKVCDRNFDRTLIEDFSVMNGFVCAYVYNYWDVFWQSNKSISDYGVFGKSGVENLPKTRDKWDREIIDVLNNHGRQTLLKDFWLLAANEMWFSNKFFEMVAPKTKLLKFPGCSITKNGLVYCFLENIDAEPDQLRPRQKAFRDYINAKRIEKKFSLI